MHEKELAIYRANVCIIAMDIVPDIARNKAPVESHIYSEGIEI